MVCAILTITYSRVGLSFSGYSFASKSSILKRDFPPAYAQIMFDRALAGRVHTQMIRICVPLGSDKVNLTLSYARISLTAFSLGNCKVS